MHSPALPAASRAEATLSAVHTAPYGVSQARWEDALRTHMQQQMELAVHRLSQATPAMLTEEGPKFEGLDLVIPLPCGDRIRFVASLELVEG